MEQISSLSFFFASTVTCLFQLSAFSQHDSCTGNCGPRNCSSLDCAESLVACSEELVGCSQKKCQPLQVKAPPSKSSNSPHTDACVTPLWNRKHCTPAEEIFTECTESALQTIEYGPLPEIQRCMLVLSYFSPSLSSDCSLCATRSKRSSGQGLEGGVFEFQKPRLALLQRHADTGKFCRTCNSLHGNPCNAFMACVAQAISSKTIQACPLKRSVLSATTSRTLPY